MSVSALPEWLLQVPINVKAERKSDALESGLEGGEGMDDSDEDVVPFPKAPQTFVSAAAKKASSTGKGGSRQAILAELLPILTTLCLQHAQNCSGLLGVTFECCLIPSGYDLLQHLGRIGKEYHGKTTRNTGHGLAPPACTCKWYSFCG